MESPKLTNRRLRAAWPAFVFSGLPFLFFLGLGADLTSVAIEKVRGWYSALLFAPLFAVACFYCVWGGKLFVETVRCYFIIRSDGIEYNSSCGLKLVTWQNIVKAEKISTRREAGLEITTRDGDKFMIPAYLKDYDEVLLLVLKRTYVGDEKAKI